MLEIIENLKGFLESFGYIALFGIVFAESGLFFGFFLPGDSLLFTAGLLAGKGVFDINIVLVGIAVSAVLGDQVGYWMGQRFGKKLFNRPGSFFFDPKHVKEAEEFYKKHGNKTIILARFFPAIRTFAPIVAGIASMDYKTFVVNNVIGGVLWTLTFVLLGYFFGALLPVELITAMILAIIVLSLIPIGIKLLKRK